MSGYPVHLQIERTPHPRRIHVVLRTVLLVALGTISMGAIYWIAYLALPALVALALLQRGSGRYFTEDAPRVVRALRWLAEAYAYLWLLTDIPPTAEPGPVELRVELTGTATARSALLRLLYSIPALLLVILLSIGAVVCWVIGAAFILAVERLPA